MMVCNVWVIDKTLLIIIKPRHSLSILAHSLLLYNKSINEKEYYVTQYLFKGIWKGWLNFS